MSLHDIIASIPEVEISNYVQNIGEEKLSDFTTDEWKMKYDGLNFIFDGLRQVPNDEFTIPGVLERTMSLALIKQVFLDGGLQKIMQLHSPDAPLQPVIEAYSFNQLEETKRNYAIGPIDYYSATQAMISAVIAGATTNEAIRSFLNHPPTNKVSSLVQLFYSSDKVIYPPIPGHEVYLSPQKEYIGVHIPHLSPDPIAQSINILKGLRKIRYSEYEPKPIVGFSWLLGDPNRSYTLLQKIGLPTDSYRQYRLDRTLDERTYYPGITTKKLLEVAIASITLSKRNIEKFVRWGDIPALGAICISPQDFFLSKPNYRKLRQQEI